MKQRASKQRGFTLLEVLVATVIMGIAVVGLLTAMSTSMRTAGRLTDYDRAALLSRAKMDELLLDPRLRWHSVVEGRFEPSLMGGTEGGWRARLTPFELPPQPLAGFESLDRVELEVWWMSGGARKTFTLDGYRTHIITPEEAEALAGQAP